MSHVRRGVGRIPLRGLEKFGFCAGSGGRARASLPRLVTGAVVSTILGSEVFYDSDVRVSDARYEGRASWKHGGRWAATRTDRNWRPGRAARPPTSVGEERPRRPKTPIYLGRVEVESAYPSVVQHAETAQPARSHCYWCLTF